MTDTEIETLSTLFIMTVGTLVFSGSVGWWVFVRVFKMVDDHLQDRELRKKGRKKMLGEDGKVWYVGYGD